MEMAQLNKWQEEIIYHIFQERFEEISVPGLNENIAEYKQIIKDHAAQLRNNCQLTHSGRLVKSKPDFKNICIDKGWYELLTDAEGTFYA